MLTTAMSTLMPIFHLTFISFLISFSGTSFSIFLLLFFYSINLFYLIFVLYQRLQCRHSCQYFVHMYCDSTVVMWSAIALAIVHSLYREWSQWRPLQMAVNCWTKNLLRTHKQTNKQTNVLTHPQIQSLYIDLIILII